MAIEHGFVYSFKEELFSGTHDFSSDTLKLALYTSSASLTLADTTAYSATNEASGTGYTAGGITVSAATGFPKMNDSASGGIAAGQMWLLDLDNATFSVSSLTARAALLYNSSKSNKAICILDFGSDLTVTSELQVIFPNPDVSSAFLRAN